MKKVYHVSPISGIKELEPRVSTHGKAYVYGSVCLPFTILFGTRKNNGDFDGSYGMYSDGTVFFIEGFEGSLEYRFKGESCSIYELDHTNFEGGKTGFGGEIVSEKPVKVLKEKRISDVYELILKYEKQGKIKIYRYSKDKEYQSFIRAHIKDRLTRFNILNNRESVAYKFCMEHYADIVDEIMKEQEYFGFSKKSDKKAEI